jgi:alkanesulfonate monooxygenase SsuD/methylene tetrahydromethanopterin reductase-like flavin-dependent oxidoreductase (luciferase family)
MGSADTARPCYAVRFCLMIEGQEGVCWDDWIALAQTGERLGFEALFRSDHYFSRQGVTGRGSTDAWTLATQVFRRSRDRWATEVHPI